MRILIAVIALVLISPGAFGDAPDLVEGARRAIAYFHSKYAQCAGAPVQPSAWYGALTADPAASAETGSIHMVADLRIHFTTEVLSQAETLNGYEFKATASVEPGPNRWWSATSKAWMNWEVGEITPAIVLVKRNGGWSTQMSPNRTEPGLTPVTRCSKIPAFDGKRP